MMRWVLPVLMLGAAGGAAADGLRPVGLRCEYRENPLGIGVAAPRLTWSLEADANGARQSRYRILVASTPELLAADTGDLWDTGEAASSETALIAYAGKPLAPRARCHWKVRVWDAAGAASEWSAPAHWTIGLLAPEDWSAKWIGYDAPEGDAAAAAQERSAALLGGAQWIWSGEGAGVDAPAGRAWLRRAFEAAGAVESARLAVTADNECRVWVNGKDANAGGAPIAAFNTVYALDVKALLQPGRNVVAIEANNTGDAANPAGAIARLEIAYADGTSLVVASDATWKASAKRGGSDWNAPGFDDAAYGTARVVARLGEGPWNPQASPGLVLPPPPCLRKEFALGAGVRRATAYATALGIVELRINGARVGEDYFTPGWTDYGKRVHYATYDVTALLRAGETNAVGAILADGWYAGYAGFRLLNNLERPRGFYGGEPRMAVQIEVEYDDGRTERIGTDETWRAAYGAIREADLLMGESHDLTRGLGAWDQAGYDDAQWAAPALSPAPAVPVQAHPGVPVRKLAAFTAQTRTEPQPGVYVYDLGQNMVGWARIAVRGKAGQRVQVRHAEMLQPDGTLYTVALRKARAIDRYVLRGDGEEVLEPGFTFHGFRYVEITGIDTPPAPEQVTGVVLGSQIEQTGHFASSEPLLNQLFHNIVWGQRGNYLEIPTDCPQRDERLGWTGDAQFFMPTSAYTADIGAFFTKWLVDLVHDAQLPDGSWADVAPNLELGGGNVAWGDAAIICTYEMYRYYGDTRVIEQHYDRLAKGMQFLEGTSKDGIRSKIGYGDWLNLGGNAKDEVICTAYFAYLAGLMAEMAEVIGRDAEAQQYRDLHARVREAFIRSFVAEDGKLRDSSQTGYALAFTMGLLPEERKAGAAAYFEQEIARFDHHLATGFIGTPRLLPGLQAAGKLDLAYRLLMTKTFPSWLYQVTLGATTMWERWDGWTPEKGFQDPGMNSFNHYAFGAVGQFLYEAVGGIRALEPGFRRIAIAPLPGGGLTHAEVRYRSIRGEIRSAWKQEGEVFTLDVTVPPNVDAEVRVPAPPGAAIEVSDPANAALISRHEDAMVYQVASGVYRFAIEPQ